MLYDQGASFQFGDPLCQILGTDQGTGRLGDLTVEIGIQFFVTVNQVPGRIQCA